MAARHIWMGFGVVALGAVRVCAQTPVLGSIESPYASIQSSVQVAGHTYGPGAVAYGPVGTPLVLSGSDLGPTGTVEFIAYKNGVVDQDLSPVLATPTVWGSGMIFVPVPSGAMTGMVQVIVEGKVSNPLPFIVTSGAYAGSSCPAGPTTTELQIITSSLHDGQVGQSYSATLSASGGTQPYAWSVESGTLPSGLSLNAATGTISGMPTTAVSPASLTFEVTDSSSPHQSNQAVLDLTIEPQQMNAATVYSYTATYDGDGNVSSYGDSIDNSSGSIMGSWTFKYDDLNRLQSGQATAGVFNGQNLCWAYDTYGNRTAQVAQSSACPSSESGLTPTVSYNSSNQMSSGLVGYDAAGNITSDATSGNSYLYDAEGRVCAVKSQPVPGTYTMTGYIYDADGSRVAKGTITSMSCDPTVNGFQITENYVLGPSGEELSMLDGNNNWKRTNVYAAGKLMGTYDAAGLHFHLEDPLGTRRMQLSGNPNFVGCPETDIQSLPYGDGLYSFPDQYACASADDATPLHFTGKERDQESGNDYLGARYYASTMGRFLSPDWSAKASPVPYATFTDPQSLNLYSYVRNNPLTRVDADGHLSCVGYWCTPSGNGVTLHDQFLRLTEKQQNTVFSQFASSLRLQVTSDTAQAGIRDVVYSAAHLSQNGNLQNLNDGNFQPQGKFGPLFSKLDVTENNSEKCRGCTKGPDGKWHSTDKDGNRFEDLVSPQPAGNRLQSFTVTPHDGGPSAPIDVRLAGQDYGTIGQWSDGLHIPYINGYSYQEGLPGPYAPTQ